VAAMTDHSHALRTLRAFPTLFRIGVAETLAYRGGFLMAVVTAGLPLILLGLWKNAAAAGPIAGYSSTKFVAYFLGIMIVRNLTETNVSWRVGEEIRTGELSMRLLRPIHPVLAFAAQSAAGIPIRSIVSIPFALYLVFGSDGIVLGSEPLQLAALLPSLILAWFIAFGVKFALGSCGFWITRTYGLNSWYTMAWSVCSGFSMPIALVQHTAYAPVAHVAYWLPFYYTIGAPVDLMTTHMTSAEVLHLMGGQLAWAAAIMALVPQVWRAGVRRYEAVGA
jgi:ABC-2 type transport system permease protein